MNGDKAARILTGLAVLAVAVVAGLVSFSHVEALALAHGYALATIPPGGQAPGSMRY